MQRKHARRICFLITIVTLMILAVPASGVVRELSFAGRTGSLFFDGTDPYSSGLNPAITNGQFINNPVWTRGVTMYGTTTGFGTKVFFDWRGKAKQNPAVYLRNGSTYPSTLLVRLSEYYQFNHGSKGWQLVVLAPGQEQWVSFVATDVQRIDVMAASTPWMFFVGALRWEENDEGDSLDVSFEITDDTPETQRRVLTHKYGEGAAENGWKHFGADDSWPSPFQSSDGEIEIVAKVTKESGAPAAGKQVYFRVTDPEDPASYVHADKKHTGDNRDPLDAAFKDMKTPKPVPGGGPAGTVSPASAVSDSTGTVRTMLRITSRYAGDNYRVIASTDPAFPCANDASCAQSGELVAWKRIYLETNRMYKKGGLLADDVPPGSTLLPVQTLKRLPSPPFEIALLHAWRFKDNSIGFAQETVTVTDKITATAKTPARLVCSPTSQHYFGGETIKTDFYEDLADGFGVFTTSESDLYQASDGLMEQLFNPGFAEYVLLRGSIKGNKGTIPAIDPISNMRSKQLLDLKWGRTNANPIVVDGAVAVGAGALPNHQVSFVASALSGDSNTGGSTWVGQGVNGSWLFRKSLDRFGISDDKRAAEALAHEVAHQWVVNPAVPGKLATWGPGHCGVYSLEPPHDAKRVFDSELFCVLTNGLYTSDQATDGRAAFHYHFDGVSSEDSELIEIREKNDPIPQYYPGRPRTTPW